MTPMPRFWLTFTGYLGLDPRQQRHWWGSLGRSRWSRAAAWRRSLLLFEATQTPGRTIDDICRFWHGVARPTEVMEVLEEQVQEGTLTRQECTPLQERVLVMLDRAGGWR